ncbi:hybrid sensor histidine kinase/response regulator transcription factor [Saccharicrinis aurantiacus]|uniref:hybrid sensor histidine kinase/response regulator transcription factor n=1 Tax=Saccharicrinis aurantiacus TaxID=1849719 RepID=UPI0024901968|nr:ATP-binding protein [Saccharicrinis aurantiacus]
MTDLKLLNTQKLVRLRVMLTFMFLCVCASVSLASSTQVFTVNEGLSLNEVRGVYQDKYLKYIWIYTQNGLNCYNGHSIEKLYLERDSLKSNNFINDITEDNLNQLWLATNIGLACYNYVSKEWVPLPLYLQKEKYQHICMFNDSLLYGIRNHELVELKIQGENISMQEVSIPAKAVNDITVVDDQLIISSSRGIFAYNPNKKQVESIIPEIKKCTQLKYLAKTNSIWIKQNSSSFIIPIENGHFDVSGMNDYHIYLRKQTGIDYKIGDVAFSDGKYWFATQQGLISVDNASQNIKFKNPPNYWMNSLLADNKGNLWCGTWQKGVVKYANRETLFNTYRKTDTDSKIPSGLISSILEIDSNSIALATETAGLVIYNRTMGQFKSAKGNNYQLSSNIMHCVKKDWEGRVWGGYYDNGFNIISGKNKETYNTVINAFLSRNARITCDDFCFDDKNKIIYIATTFGVLSFDTESLQISTLIKSNEGYISSLFKDEKDNLWIASKNGLKIYDLKSDSYNIELEKKAQKLGLTSVGITSIYCDSKNSIWIGTYGDGLYYYQTNKGFIEAIQQAEHIDFKVVYSIVEDDLGRIWLGTNSGLVAFDYSTKRFLNYKKVDGIQDNQFNYNAAAKASDGTLFMGGINGFTYFKPKNIKANIELPSPVVSDITIGNDHYNVGQLATGLSTSYDKNSFEISFFTPDYTSSESYIYKYFLEGYSSEERLCTTGTNKVFFSNVPPGKYKLKLWVALPNSAWSAPTYSPEIVIYPPWYKSNVAYILYVVILFALFFITYRITRKQALYKSSIALAKLEKKQAEEINQAKLRFFTDIAHEIRTPLTLILGPIKEIFASRKLDYELQHSLNTVHKSANKLTNLMDELLLFRKAENGALPLKLQECNIAHLIKDNCELYQYELSGKNIEIHYFIDENIKMVCDADKIEKVITNLLSNAIKHTPKDGTINIKVEELNKGIELSVQDTGKGISSDEINTIFNRFYQTDNNNQHGFGIGLALAKKIIEAHNGTLNVESSLENGSTFRAFIPQLVANVPGEYKYDKNTSGKVSTQNTEKVTMKNALKGSILIVEDNAEISKYIASIFEKYYNVTVRPNGKEGLEYATNHIPDIIISDYQMPEMNGITMCQKLKSAFITSHIPVVLLSAYNEVEEQLKGLEVGADDYIGKPFNSDILLQKINNILQSRKQLIESFKKGDHVDLSNFEQQDQRFLDKLNKIIMREMKHENFGVPVLCEQIGIGKTTLNDKLRRMLDVSTAEYIRKMRLKEGYRLITEENFSPSDAAYALGFSPAYFSSCFKKEYGVSPGKI